ncbi:DUF3574 domain-containing protein [Occallatibacter savannae]|uniref:DUF3574 domain-containing protein n=1 Tax=Occallatibacter savannae TaxID=1002691 RepID=UPI000D690352|nr:DUF3574 domain-containing protein [Occallatibacter savannae]
MHVRSALAALVLTLAALGCEHKPVQAGTARTAPVLRGDAAHPDSRKGWVDTRLYFGLGPADQPGKGVSEMEWRAFLDREVTPRFPDGLSVLDVYGQWQGKNEKAPERLRTKCLVIEYPNTAENRAKVDAIRVAWKAKTGDQSVMRVTEPADVSF